MGHRAIRVRRFDRSTSGVSRRLGLVELLPASVQQQVRDGVIAAHVAMKFLVPVARSRPEDCRRMAEGFARYRSSVVVRATFQLPTNLDESRWLLIEGMLPQVRHLRWVHLLWRTVGDDQRAKGRNKER